jgi:hypothetical protein
MQSQRVIGTVIVGLGFILSGAIAFLVSMSYDDVVGSGHTSTFHFIFFDLFVFPGFALLCTLSVPLIWFRSEKEFGYGLAAIPCALVLHWIIAAFVGHEAAPYRLLAAIEVCLFLVILAWRLCLSRPRQ